MKYSVTMKEKMYIHLLILCGIFCREILGTLSAGESSDLLVRKKRVISHEQGADVAISIRSVPYLVSIQTETETTHCAGAVLSHYSIITAASCFDKKLTHYRILSGSSYAHRSTVHQITSGDSYFGNAPHGPYDGIILLTVDPPFNYTQSTHNIPLHHGPPLPTGTPCTVSGWGNRHPVLPPMTISRRLRTIIVPIMDHGECHNIYRNISPITNKHICTYAPLKGCGVKDVGTPLVFNGQLVGIYSWKGLVKNQRNPDVYINVQLPEYQEWIRQNAILM